MSTTTAPSQPKHRTPSGVLQYRSHNVEQRSINKEARTIEFALSSEEPYRRWWGTEVLSHADGAVRLGRLNSGRHPLLVEHSSKDQVGVIEKAWIGPDKVLHCTARFGNSARAQEIFQDVCDGIRSLVSVGYQVNSMRLLKAEGDDETYEVDDWEPFEGSIVAIPADPTVGIGREAEQAHIRSLIQTAKKGNPPMTAPTTTPEPAPAPAPAVTSVTENSRDLLAKERSRVKEITALGDKFGMRDLADKAADDGTSYDAFREIVFGKLQESGKLKLAETPEIGLTDKEAKNFSFTKLILSALDPTNVTLQKAAAFELECSEAAQAKRDSVSKEREGARTIPVDVLSRGLNLDAQMAAHLTRSLLQRMGMHGGFVGQRDLVVGTPTAGGNLVATELLGASFIDILVNQMAVMGLGATMLNDLNGNIAIPRATSGSVGYWVAENNDPTESQQAFDQVSLSPKTCGAFVDYSRRLLMQSSIAVEQFVRMDIARSIGLMLDLAAIAGTGASNQPRGILNTSGIGSVAGGTNGADPTWDHIVNLESAVANANAPTDNLAYLTNTKVRGKLKRTQKFTGTNGQEIWQGNTLNGYNARVSNQVPSNLTKGTSSGVCSAILFGNWTDLIIGMWGGLDILFDPYTGGTAGTKRLIALQDVDVSVRYPVSFASMQDATTV